MLSKDWTFVRKMLGIGECNSRPFGLKCARVLQEFPTELQWSGWSQVTYGKGLNYTLAVKLTTTDCIKETVYV